MGLPCSVPKKRSRRKGGKMVRPRSTVPDLSPLYMKTSEVYNSPVKHQETCIYLYNPLLKGFKKCECKQRQSAAPVVETSTKSAAQTSPPSSSSSSSSSPTSKTAAAEENAVTEAAKEQQLLQFKEFMTKVPWVAEQLYILTQNNSTKVAKSTITKSKIIEASSKTPGGGGGGGEVAEERGKLLPSPKTTKVQSTVYPLALDVSKTQPLPKLTHKMPTPSAPKPSSYLGAPNPNISRQMLGADSNKIDKTIQTSNLNNYKVVVMSKSLKESETSHIGSHQVGQKMAKGSDIKQCNGVSSLKWMPYMTKAEQVSKVATMAVSEVANNNKKKDDNSPKPSPCYKPCSPSTVSVGFRPQAGRIEKPIGSGELVKVLTAVYKASPPKKVAAKLENSETQSVYISPAEATTSVADACTFRGKLLELIKSQEVSSSFKPTASSAVEASSSGVEPKSLEARAMDSDKSTSNSRSASNKQ